MRKLLLVTALLFSSLAINAQSSWGVTGGKLFNNFNLDNPNSKSNSTINSYSLGLFYQYNFGKRSQVYATLTHDDKTTQRPYSSRSNKTIELRYLTLDIGYNILFGRLRRLSVGTGIYYGRLIHKDIIFSEQSFEYNVISTQNFDMGLSLNAQYKITPKLSALVKGTYGTTYNNIYEEVYIKPGFGCFSKVRGVSFSNSSLTVGINYLL